jgi:hypothetical protein
VLPVARPLMSSAPAASTVPESSGAWPYSSPPKAGGQWVEFPRGRAGRTWQPWPSTSPLMSRASAVPKSSGTRLFPSLLDRSAALLAARPLMSSTPTTPTIPESSGERTFLYLLERPVDHVCDFGYRLFVDQSPCLKLLMLCFPDHLYSLSPYKCYHIYRSHKL